MRAGAIVSTELRTRVRRGIDPVARGFGRLGLTPNALTVIGFAIAVLAAWAAASTDWVVAGLLIAFGAIFDLFDGALARATNRASRFGAFLDSTIDRASEAVIYVGIAAGLLSHVDADGSFRLFGVVFDGIVGPLIAAAAMAAAFMVSYTRAKSESLGFSPGAGMASVGLAPREVRVAILAVGSVVAGLYEASHVADPPAGVIPAPQVWWILLVGSLALITVLATVTTIQRIVHVHREATKQERQ